MSRICAVVLMAALGAQDEFESLFNGKDLAGWEGDAKLWSVTDGAITGRTTDADALPYNKFLIWKGTVADFELRLRFRLQGGNSGIQFRSKHLKEKGEYVVGGYQADIDAKNTYTGILYEEQGRGILAQRGQRVVIDEKGAKQVAGSLGDAKALGEAIDPAGWNDYVIVAQGNRITQAINGKPMIEVVDNQADKRALEGVLALQLHRGPPMTVQFKDIRLKRLKGEPPKKSDKSSGAAPAWIWSNEADGKPRPAVLFRRDFELKFNISSARLYATCDDQMTLWIDGKEVLSHDVWQSPVFRDVTGFLITPENIGGAGRHAISVRGRNGASAAGLLVKLVCESHAAETVTIVTDGAWRVAERPAKGWNETEFDASKWAAATVVGQIGGKPWSTVTEASLDAAARLREPSATPPAALKVARDFKVELLYSVPRDREGSWVAMCVDPKGRLIVSDQYGSLFRVTPPPLGGNPARTKVERIMADIGEAQGLLWAFDSLYVSVNGTKYASGLYRVRDTDGDDQLDRVEKLRDLAGKGEHGPHAVLLAPDGKSLYVVCGNHTDLTRIDGTLIPPGWQEDHLLTRMWDARGHARGRMAPGGWIARVDPDGRNWELVSIGYRNQYDAAFNRHGDLFTYDSDMEWDINTPWYRPTRVCLASSGSELGWRSGSGVWPSWYPESLPAILDIGHGSPTGVAFGTGAKFPAKYQEALYVADWSYGKLYAVHLTPEGSAYRAQAEDFMTGAPLPLTDLVVNPADGAMYFATGGRRTTCGLYRVTYAGRESTAPSTGVAGGEELRAIRHRLEDFHGRKDSGAVDAAWPHLGHADRFLRYAARVAVEHQDAKTWQERALVVKEPQAALTALVALARAGEKALQPRLLEALDRIAWSDLQETQRLELLRAYGLAFIRMGRPGDEARKRTIARFDPHFPSGSVVLNAELCQILVYLEAPGVAARSLKLLAAAPTQEEQIDFARCLRELKTGWTADQRREYFGWFVKAAAYKGGMSFAGFIQMIKADAVAKLSPEEKAELKPVLEARPQAGPAVAAPPRAFERKWTMAEAAPIVEHGLVKRDFDRGRAMFAAAQCFACHRFGAEGGSVGPDLTSLAGRFNPRDVLESLLEPSKVISDQYEGVVIKTTDGRVITGRIINVHGDSFSVNTNMLDPTELVRVDMKQIEVTKPSTVSMMPEGLLDTLSKDELLDLVAYLLSRGERTGPMFK